MDEWQKFFDDLEGNLAEDDPRIKNIDAMRAVIGNIHTTKGRKYAISKILNDPKFGFTDAEAFPESMRSYWNISNQDDYTPPDVEAREAKRLKEAFWDQNSPDWWGNLDKAALERRAADAGYSDVSAYKQDLYQIQNRKDREKLLEDEFGGKVGSFLIQTVLPRTTEAVLRGEDFGPKDVLLDELELGLYSLNPAERGIAVGMKATKPFLGKELIGKTAGYMANPLTMETADALAYGNNPNSQRNEFNMADVLLGTGINAGVGGVSDRVSKKLFGSEMRYPEKLTKVETEASKAAKEAHNGKVETIQGVIEGEKNKLASLEAQGAAPSTISKQKTKISKMETYLNNVMKSEPETKFRNPNLKEKSKFYGQLYGVDAATLLGNKTGDAISENPQMTKRVLRQGVRIPMAGPFIGDAVDWYYNRQKGMSEKDKINELIYGLEDWRK